jgi:hypothetical protein
MATEKTKAKVDSQMREDMHKHGKNEHRYKIRGMLMDGKRRMEMTFVTEPALAEIDDIRPEYPFQQPDYSRNLNMIILQRLGYQINRGTTWPANFRIQNTV